MRVDMKNAYGHANQIAADDIRRQRSQGQSQEERIQKKSQQPA